MDVQVDGAIVLGHARWVRSLWLGALLLLAGLAGFGWLTVRAISQVDWYAHKPTSWVISDLRSGTVSVADRAIRELRRRFDAKELKPAQFVALRELALTDEANPAFSSNVSQGLLDILGMMYERSMLTIEQQRRFLDQLVRVELKVKSPVGPGDLIPCEEKFTGRFPANLAWKYEVEPHGRMVDGIEDNEAQCGRISGWAWGGSTSTSSSPRRLAPRPVGEHRIVSMPIIRLYDSGAASVFEHQVRLEASFTVFDATTTSAPSEEGEE